MSEQLLISQDYGAPLTMEDLEVGHTAVAALAFTLWDVLIELSTEIELIWSCRTSAWIRWTYIFMRYVAVVALSSIIVIITSISTNVTFTSVGCKAWQIWEMAVTLSIIWMLDAILILRLYAVYNRSKLMLWIILSLYVAEIAIMVYGSIATIDGMVVTPGCLILTSPRTFFACWLSALSFQTIVIILMAVNFFRTKFRQRSSSAILRILIRDGSWAYALIFLVTLSNSVLYNAGSKPIAGTPYAWAIALYSFAGCHLQMNLLRNKDNRGSGDSTSDDGHGPKFTSHIEMRGISCEGPRPQSTDLVGPIILASPQLPYDIIEILGGYLYHHRSALAACSLTCRLWNNAIRPHIYHTITLTSEEDTSRLYKAVHAESAVGPWIREIRIASSRPSLGVYEFFLGFPSTFNPKLLPNLRSLQFRGQSTWYTSAEQSNKAIDALIALEAFCGISRICFENCSLPYDFAKGIVCAFPELVDLHLHNLIYIRGYQEISIPRYYVPQKLRSLRVHDNDRLPADNFYEELLLPDVPPFARAMQNLTTLEFHFGSNTSAVLEDLARVVFPSSLSSIQHLTFYFPSPSRISAVVSQSCNRFIVNNMNLAMFNQLRTFHVRGLNHADTTAKLLRGLNSPYLHHVDLGIKSVFLLVASCEDYRQVDEYLTDSSVLESLSEVHVFAYNAEAEDLNIMSAAAARILPRATERGFLRTSVVADPDVRYLPAVDFS
ncbi:hypothetical protein EIP91_007826 [Steccherinum ochraceum]|uniref:DUF6533 domain-containing protein n=1 Tax=Steccherinum ochraceum TaxID=92696 RepID=A0A4V2MVB8_9APHY|nr:hypothetical protein EIP91_007826 [Steccherinum ochraceum]